MLSFIQLSLGVSNFSYQLAFALAIVSQLGLHAAIVPGKIRYLSKIDKKHVIFSCYIDDIYFVR